MKTFKELSEELLNSNYSLSKHELDLLLESVYEVARLAKECTDQDNDVRLFYLHYLNRIHSRILKNSPKVLK